MEAAGCGLFREESGGRSAPESAEPLPRPPPFPGLRLTAGPRAGAAAPGGRALLVPGPAPAVSLLRGGLRAGGGARLPLLLLQLLALVPRCGPLLPPALASACRKPQLCPRGQKPSFEKTTHGCAELLPPASPLLPVEPGLLAVALLARAAAAAAPGPCLVGAREPWPGSEEQRPPLAGAGGRLADVPWLLPAPPVLLLQAAAAAALVSC